MTQLYFMIGSLSFKATYIALLSSYSTIKWWFILCILVVSKDDGTNYINSNTGHHV